MKKLLPVLTTVYTVLLMNAVQAQNWVVGGNNLAGVGRIGANTNSSLIFETNNTERGRLTSNGLWGFGTSFPNAKVHINSVPGRNPLRIQVDNATKFVVHTNGGVAVGTYAVPPVNGLFVTGNTGFGTITPTAKVQINHNSGVLNPQLLLQEDQFDYARLNFGNTSTPNVFAIAGLPATDNAVARLNFYYNGLGDIMTIRGDGKVGIGTTTPENGLHIKQQISNRAIEWQHESTSDFWTVGIGTFTKNCRFEYNGVFKAQFSSFDGSLSLPSDSRLKEEIEPATTPLLSKFMQLKPAKYYYKDSRPVATHKSMGLIAQEVEQIFPELVHSDDGDYKMLNYTGLTIISVKVIQELQQVLSAQQQEINAYKERLYQLETALGTANPAHAANSDILGISLEQNQPNPFNQTTTFRYTLPVGANGLIKIYNATSGTLVKSLPAPITGQVQVSAYDLKAGTYVYTLVVNGKLAASKQMLIVQ